MEQIEDPPRTTPQCSPLLRMLLVVAGIVCVALGIAGIVLPLLPTTPFLLLAAACFVRSSPRLDNWLHCNRLFGPYLRAYRDGHGIPLRVKVSIISLLWISITASAIFAVPPRLWALRLVLVAIAVFVSIHVARIRTRQPTRREA
ncbi:MAG: YbaN family protein [Propionivibrio sp.]